MKVWRAALVAAVVSSAAAADPMSDGFAWLRARQDARGAFGGSTGENELVATHEAVQAFSSAGQSSSAEVENARLYLALLPPPRDHELVQRVAISLQPTAFRVDPEVLMTHAPGFAAQDAASGAWSLLAIQAAGDVSHADSKALARTVLGQALPSGCFAIADNDASPELTAQLARSLRAFGHEPAVGFARARALQCLATLQQPGGGFGTPEATAVAALAFVEAELSYGPALAAARAYLLSTQRPDGSWGSVRATALALQSLGGAPDWEMTPRQLSGRTHFNVSANEVIQGQTVTGFGQVRNSANTDASPAPLRLRAVSLQSTEVVELGVVTIPALSAGQTLSIPVSLATTGLLGRYRLEAEVDALRVLPELDRTNNLAIAYLNVVVAADLMLSTASVSFSSGGPTTVVASVRVRNLGSPLSVSVPVELRKGNVATGTLLGSFVIPAGVASGADFTGTVSFSNAGFNGFTAIWAVVDPANVLLERDEENNAALRFYESGAEAPVDLQLLTADISVVGEAIRGQVVTVRGVVRNLAPRDANRFQVTAFDSGGVPLASTEVDSVAAASSAPFTVSFLLQGTITLTFTADSNGQLNDTNRNNNTATFTVVPSTSLANLLIASASVGLTGVGAQNGQPVTFSVVVRNTGGKPAATSIRVTEEGDGTVEVTSLGLQLDRNESRTVSLGPFATPNRASAYRLCLDAFELIEESNENDNCFDLSLGPQTTNVSVASKDFTMTPVGVDVGQKVSFTATVRNASGVTARGVLEWWQGGPGTPTGRVLAEQVVSVAPHGVSTVSYDFIRDEGIPEVNVRLTRITPRNPQTNAVQGGRHLFLEEIVDLTYPGDAIPPYAQLVRTGRLTGSAAPELVLGLERPSAGSSAQTEVVVLERSSGKYAPLWSHQMPGAPVDLSLIDLDSNGSAELVAFSSQALSGLVASRSAFVHVLDAFGAVRWTRSFPLELGDISGQTNRLSLTDYDSDGVVDVVTAMQHLRVHSGVDGSLLLDVDLAFNDRLRTSATAVDVTGDGVVEFLVDSSATTTALYSHAGQLLWQRSAGGDTSASGAVLDMNFDGKGELIEAGLLGQTNFVDLASNVAVSSRPGFVTLNTVIGGALRQDGLAYAVVSPWNAGRLTAVRGDFSQLWNEQMAPTLVNSGDVDLQVTLADLEGRGRPQVIGFSCYYSMLLVDGRTGKSTLPTTQGPGTACVRGGQPSVGNFAQQPPVVADLAGNGLGSSIVFTHSESTAAQNVTGAPVYGHAEALIFHSPRWKKMPPTWPTHSLVKGRIGDDLKLQGGTDSFSWWASHNTYNQQFDTEPARLLPDLTASLPKQGPATANQAFLITATLHNVGGLPASNVPVAFWDGDPADGGVRLGGAVAAGPLAVRRGQVTVSFNWNAWPEGRHELCVVANEADAVEESGSENNTTCTTVLVRAPAQACDLQLNVASLAVSPQPASPGDMLSISASVTNVGSLGCAATTVSFGDGVQRLELALPALAVGATHALIANAVAFAGTQTFTVVVDEPQLARDGDRGNNTAHVSSAAGGGATAAELVILLVESQPSPAYPGELVSVTATVQNRGAPAAASRLEVLVGAQALRADVADLATGESAVVTLSFTAPGTTANAVARVDADARIPELDETNNDYPFAIAVVAAPVTASAVASPSSAGPDAPVALEVTLVNVGAVARELAVVVELVALSGASVSSAHPPFRVVAAPGTTGVTLPWNTARTPPGAYGLKVIAREGARALSEATAQLAVLPEAGAAVELVVDRGTYGPRDTAIIYARADNASRNAPLGAASATVTMRDALGATLQSSTRALPVLPPLGHLDFSDSHAVSPSAVAGAYTVTLELRDDAGVIIATTSTRFVVEVLPARSVTVQSSVAPLFPIIPPLPVRVVSTNTSSVALPAGVLALELFDISRQQLLAPESAASKNISIGAGMSRTDDFLLPTVGLQPGLKLLVVRLDGVIVQRLRIEAIAVTDNEPPVIDVSGVFDLQVTRFDVVPEVIITDASAYTSTVLLDGAPFVSGTTVGTAGPHLLVVSATDVFGNSAFRQVRFTVDKSPPVLTLAGVADGAFSPTAVTLTWTVTDATATTVVASLDSLPVESGQTVSSEGPHVWTVTATDAAGNSSSETRQFVLDFTPAVITISGVNEGEARSSPVALTFAATDPSPIVTLTATLDGAPFVSGSTVSQEGAHVLTVLAIDAAGNPATATRAFTLDFTAPLITVVGVSDDGLYATPRSISFSASDATVVSVEATVDGTAFGSGDIVSGEGPHLLIVSATDAAGNTATKSVAFRIDLTAPVISVTGVTEGATGPQFTPVVTVTDASAVTTTVTLNGAPFVSGTLVAERGSYVLEVHAVDAAGHQAAATVHFTIHIGPHSPVFQFAGCATGTLLVRNNAQSAGGLATNGAATMENSAVIFGDLVSGGDLTMRNATRVSGVARYGGALTLQNSATIQGGAQRLSPAPTPCACSYDVHAELAAAAATNDNAAISAPLTNGGLALHNVTLILPGGTYHLAFLELRGTALLKVTVGQAARVFVEHGVRAENDSTLGGPPSQSGALLIVSGAESADGGAIELENASDAWLRLYAPAADVRLQNSATLSGAVVARNLALQNNHRLVSDTPSDGGLPLVCP